jgi:hypothetical protein
LLAILQAEIFEKYDTDNSGTIDAHELDAMLYELGIKVSKTKMEQARKELGITKYTGEVGLFDFEEWWRKGYGARFSHAHAHRLVRTCVGSKSQTNMCGIQ